MKYRHRETNRIVEARPVAGAVPMMYAVEDPASRYGLVGQDELNANYEPLPDDSPVYISGGCPPDAPVGVTTTASAEPPDTPADKGKPERPVVTGAKYRHKETGEDFDAIVMNDTVFLSETGPCFPGRVWYDWGHELLNVFDPLPDDSLVQPGLGIVVDTIASAGTLPPDTPASTGTDYHADVSQDVEIVARLRKLLSCRADQVYDRVKRRGERIDRMEIDNGRLTSERDFLRRTVEGLTVARVADPASTGMVSRQEALAISRRVLETAEAERKEAAEREAGTGMTREIDKAKEAYIDVNASGDRWQAKPTMPEPGYVFLENMGLHRENAALRAENEEMKENLRHKEAARKYWEGHCKEWEAHYLVACEQLGGVRAALAKSESLSEQRRKCLEKAWVLSALRFGDKRDFDEAERLSRKEVE